MTQQRRPVAAAHIDPAPAPEDGDCPPPIPEGLPASLTRALRWLDGRLDEPVRIETLATVAGVRPRTLEAHFRLYLKTTPLGWARRVRLARVRRQLLASGPDDSVTAIERA